MGIRKKIKRLLFKSERERARDIKAAQVFLNVNPNSSLLLLHDLGPDPVVFDIGGYLGDWTAAMLDRHPGTYHVFEPIESYAEQMKQRFADEDNIHVHPFGLGAETRSAEVHLIGDATSEYRAGGTVVPIEIRSISDFVKDQKIERIDLLAINAEGAEYEVLDEFLRSDLIHKVDRFLIQFHRVVENAEAKRHAIQQGLRSSFECVYDFPFVWELWRRKGLKNTETQDR
jgi:FkbM family methyltransferase